jgi:hypothetical protein
VLAGKGTDRDLDSIWDVLFEYVDDTCSDPFLPSAWLPCELAEHYNVGFAIGEYTDLLPDDDCMLCSSVAPQRATQQCQRCHGYLCGTARTVQTAHPFLYPDPGPLCQLCLERTASCFYCEKHKLSTSTQSTTTTAPQKLYKCEDCHLYNCYAHVLEDAWDERCRNQVFLCLECFRWNQIRLDMG